MKLEWQKSPVSGDWTAGSGWGRFTIQRGHGGWYLMHGSSFDKYPTVIGTYAKRGDAQKAAKIWVEGLLKSTGRG